MMSATAHEIARRLGGTDQLALSLAPGQIDLFPDAASEGAAGIDNVFLALTAVSFLFVIALFGLMAVFLVRYRAGSRADRSNPIQKTWKYEITWSAALAIIWLGVFIWAAVVYFDRNRPPEDAITYNVLGRQWMWEIHHPSGQRELNTLHVPVGETIRLVLTSEDVIHSFYVPAFRVKQDAVPGRYTTAWFTATDPGVYHLFCAEYCGVDHARMIGRVYVMRPHNYEQWLQQEREEAPTTQPLEDAGRVSFERLGCNQCHQTDTDAIAPYLEGLYGSEVTLQDGSTVIADEQYIRESILDPAAKVVRGYQPIMPTYEGMLDEQQIAQLVAAVRALADEEPGAPQQ